jgi:hypothetical protein
VPVRVAGLDRRHLAEVVEDERQMRVQEREVVREHTDLVGLLVEPRSGDL